ncbi:hypothetical protein [Sphingobacterium cellulitidis]|uniref:hypothetical protein n=1 Tax=Sphingobacterium cellulitidis TaxID=1768011 RepID=UPI003C7C6235
MKKAIVFLIFPLLLSLTSCNKILMSAAGIKKIQEFDSVNFEKTTEYFKELYPATQSIYVSDSAFTKYRKSFAEFSRNELDQPIQILYFDKDQLKSFHANCYAKPSLTMRLDWNYDGKFDNYFPKTALEIPNNKGLHSIISNFNIPVSKDQSTIVFFWSNMLNRESKRAFKQIVDNIHKSPNHEQPNVIAINTDNSFIGFE